MTMPTGLSDAEIAEWKARRRAYGAAWREKNRDAIKAYETSDAKRASRKAWRDANPEKVRAHAAATRARDPERVAARNARYHAENKERRRQQQKEWRAKNAVKLKARKAAYYAANKARRKEAAAKWKAANRDRVATAAAAYRKTNPEIIQACRRNRKARKRAAPGSHNAADIARLLDQQGGRCAAPFCRIALLIDGYHVDHVVPLALGGGNGPDNLQILCPRCNMRKGAKPPARFLAERLL